MNHDPTQAQHPAHRERHEAMRRHAHHISRALRKKTDYHWFIVDESLTPRAVTLRGPNELRLHFVYDEEPGRGQLFVTATHPRLTGSSHHGTHRMLSLPGALGPRAIVTQISNRLLTFSIKEFSRWWIPEDDLHQQKIAQQLAEDLAGICGGDVRGTYQGFEVAFKQGAFEGTFTIDRAGRIVLKLDSTDPDAMCDLAARLPNLGNR